MPSKTEIILNKKKTTDFKFFMIKREDLSEFYGIKEFIERRNIEQDLKISTAKRLVRMIQEVDHETPEEFDDALKFALDMSEKFKTTKLYFESDLLIPKEHRNKDNKLEVSPEEITMILKESNGFWDTVLKAILHVMEGLPFDKREKSAITNKLLFFLIYFRDYRMNKEIVEKLKYNKAYKICFIAGYITQHFFNQQVISDEALKKEKDEEKINRKSYTSKIYPHYKTVIKAYNSFRNM